jgi:ligand-binding sensor domain-containing protein
LAVHAIAEDSTGDLWFAATDRILRLSRGQWSAYPLPDQLTTRTVHTQGVVPLSTGRVLVRVTGEAALTLDPVTRVFSGVVHPESRKIAAVAPRADRTALVATTRDDERGFRLKIYNGRTFQHLAGVPEFDGEIRYLCESPDGAIWLGGVKDFAYLLRGNARRVSEDSGFTETAAYTLLESPSGAIYAGGRRAILSNSSGRWREVVAEMDTVRSMVYDTNGALWVASNAGIHRFQDGVWVHHSREEALGSEAAYEIFVDSKGRIWAGTAWGINVFNHSADFEPPDTTGGITPTRAG